MRPMKKILANEGVRRVLCAIGALYIWFARVTTRWQIVNDAEAAKRWDQGQPFILAFWHSRFMMMPYWYTGSRMTVMVSQHRDAEMLVRTLRPFGYEFARGSTTRKRPSPNTWASVVRRR